MTYNIHSGAIRLQIPDFISDGNRNVCIIQRLLVKMATSKVWPWKISLQQGHEYNFRNDVIRCQMLKSTNDTFYIFIFANLWSQK